MSYLVSAPSVHCKKAIFKQQTVGTSAAQLTQMTLADVQGAGLSLGSQIVPAPDNIIVQALPGNTGTITLAPSSGVTSLGAGIVLSAGQSISLPTKTMAEWYAIASAASQGLNIQYQLGVA